MDICAPADSARTHLWGILADAPREWIVPDIPDLRDLTDSALQANIFSKPPPPAQGYQLYLEPCPIEAGREREILYPIRPPFEETIYVNRIDMFMAEGSLHFGLAMTRTVNAFPDRAIINFNTIGQGINLAALNLIHSFNFLAVSQEPELTMTFPDGDRASNITRLTDLYIKFSLYQPPRC